MANLSERGGSIDAEPRADGRRTWTPPRVITATVQGSTFKTVTSPVESKAPASTFLGS
jgi:hypothetical protein